MKPRLRLLIALWGDRYVERFTHLSLPSLLAPGNLPELAAQTDLEIVILTSAADRLKLREDAAFDVLGRIAPVEFLLIDDLIADRVFGVTLTLAYLRGVTAVGAEMLHMHFLFMNSDLVLADGSLQGVGNLVVRGCPVILANSIRAISEELESPLRERVDPTTHVLAVPPRELVSMALKALHPTQIAKIVDNDFCHSVHVNQFYWQVDANTLISRHFLMFMLCLRPERVVDAVHAFCDYSFVSEMCATSTPVAMRDSDSFFALELQHRESERDFLRIGRPTIDEIARSLSAWTTEHHRDNAVKHTLVFHAQDLPPEIETKYEEAARFIRELERKLAVEPQPFRNHPYWVGAVRAWEDRIKVLRGLAVDPAQSGTVHAGSAGSAAGGGGRYSESPMQRVYRGLFGDRPNLRIWHPDWLDYRPVAALLTRHLSRPGSRVLHVRPSSSSLDGVLHGVPACMLEDVVAGRGPFSSEGSQLYTLVLVEARREDLARIRVLVDRLRSLVAPGGQLGTFLKAPAGVPTPVDLSQDLMRHIELIAPADVSRTSFIFAGGAGKNLLSWLFGRCASLYQSRGKIAIPFVTIAMALLAVLATIHNVRNRREQDERRPVRQCSSFLMVIDC